MTHPHLQIVPSGSPSTARSLQHGRGALKLTGDAVAEAWPFIEPLVVVACDTTNGRLQPQDVLEQCLAGEHCMWLAMMDGVAEGFYLVTLRQHNDGLVAELWLAAAVPGAVTLSEMKAGIKLLEQWAQMEGAIRMEIHGRPGWGRLFSDYGEQYRVFGKELR